ncbi:Cysteine-rich RLK (RECEPTOR-like protein kinase) 8 [Cucumis melo var. makuwa]|uniref:Cysteine-rich RLK (RECEPTOR-like protein kinase) 8 n=1 Tax=Cucumis melo var. makuwa TaxID=1194695 RepID=A0A5D3DJ35_CUCMM|nr:Cysteine-rich RLK (RECEPTOR-like protein kinase) 8 [Cucumis melo var. makuwa]
MRVNIFLILLALTCVNMALFISLHVLTLNLKMDTLFTSSPSSSCQGEDDNLSIYEITSPTDAPPSRLLPSRVYFRRPPSQPSGSCHTSVPSSSCDPGPSDDLLITLRKGKRKCTYPVSSFVFYHQLSSPTYAFITSLESTSISNTVHEALSHLGWRNAMIEEMTALDDNGTWDLVSLPGGKKAISCKWVFSVKVNLDGTVTQLKAHLVAKGYAQTYGINYSDTFSPVAKLTSIRLFLSMAATHNWSLDQLDIKNDFLHGDLQEEVYMEQPLGFIAQGESDKVCRLRKSLYGLKQGPHAWFGKFSHALIRFGISSLKTFLQEKLGAKPSGTLMMLNRQLIKEGKLCKDPERYRRLVGKLNYLTVTRLDIVYFVSVAGSRENKRSTSGYCVFVGRNLVSWKTALHIASNPVFHEVDCHFICEKIQDGLVSTGYVKTEEQLGDILTKAVNGARISYMYNKLDMIDIFAPA